MLAFSKIRTFCERNSCRLILTRMNRRSKRSSARRGLSPETGGIMFFADLDMALEHCEEEILGRRSQRPSSPDDVSIWERIRKVLPEGASLSDFMAYLEPRSFEPGEYLVRQGGPPDEMMFIESGRVTVQPRAAGRPDDPAALHDRGHHDRRDRHVPEPAAQLPPPWPTARPRPMC